MTALDSKNVLPLSYRTEDGEVDIDLLTDRETVWLTELQIATLLDRDNRTINKHITTIYREDELSR